MPQLVEATAYFVAAECLANVARHSAAEVTALLRDAHVPVAPVRSPLEAVRDERVVARGETEPVRHPTLGAIPDLLTAGIPLSLGEARVGFDRLAPHLSEHTDEILGEIDGYDAQRLDRLREQGVI